MNEEFLKALAKNLRVVSKYDGHPVYTICHRVAYAIETTITEQHKSREKKL